MAGISHIALWLLYSVLMLRSELTHGAEASAPEPAVYSEVGEALESDFFPLLRVNPEDAGWEDFSQNPCNSPGWTYVYCDENTLTGVFYAPPLSNQQDQQHYSAGTPEDFRRQATPKELPANLPVLPTFEDITLYNADLQGQLPPDWSQQLPNLQYLNLSQNFNLSGGLPTEWAELKHLITLDLSSNGLSGPLPESWHALTSLQYLYLGGNQFTGSIPASWSQLNLTVLDISSNNLNGTIDKLGYTGVWHYLEYFNASYNKLTGALPPWSGNNLHAIDLSHNALSGSMPASWTDLNLTALYMTNNHLQGPLPSPPVGSWKHLHDMMLDGNALTGTFPAELTLVPLYRLLVDSNSLSGPLPVWPENTGLAVLGLSNNTFTGTLPELWSRLTDLSIVTVAGNRLTGTIPSAWERLSVVEMDLGRNNLSGRLSEGLVRNWNCSDDGDAILHVAANALTGTIPAALLACSLDASFNRLTGTLPNVTMPLYSLLNVSHNSLTGSLPSAPFIRQNYQPAGTVDVSFNNITHSLPADVVVGVARVYLQGNQLTGAIPHTWTNGEELDLSDNMLTGSLPNPWQYYAQPAAMVLWRRMESLNLSHNLLTGPFFPWGVEDPARTNFAAHWNNWPWSALHTLDVSSNRLSGSLSSPMLLNMTVLAHLNASNNFLTGPLPLGSPDDFPDPLHQSLWQTLSVLDLHNNSFQGPLLPIWGSKATVLSNLNLAQNSLTGTLPYQWELGGWQNILVLDASTNQINGSLPDTWGNGAGWQHIQRLLLHNNKLAGSFPATWSLDASAYKELQLLDVSYNALSGSLPADGALRAQMAIRPGNDGLCGHIPEGFSHLTDEDLNDLPDEPFHACPNNDLSAGGIAGIVVAGALLASLLAGLLLWRKHSYDRAIQHYQRMLEQNELLAEEIDRWIGSDMQSSCSAEQPTMAYDWYILPSRLRICRDAKEQPVRLGKGASGVVYKAVLDGHVEVACKVLFKETAKHTADNLKQFAAEVDIMLQCRHPNIVALIGAWITEDMAFIISELCEGGNLYVALAKENFAEEKSECLWYRRGKGIALDLAGAISFLSSKGIIHFDVKSSNVVLTSDYQAKLCDVGLAHMLHDQTRVQLSRARGTEDYLPPEVLIDLMGTLKADIFCYGWLLWELCTAERVIRGHNRRVKVPEECPAQIAVLIDWCTRIQPQERPTAEEMMLIVQTANPSVPKHQF